MITRVYCKGETTVQAVSNPTLIRSKMKKGPMTSLASTVMRLIILAECVKRLSLHALEMMALKETTPPMEMSHGTSMQAVSNNTDGWISCMLRGMTASAMRIVPRQSWTKNMG